MPCPHDPDHPTSCPKCRALISLDPFHIPAYGLRSGDYPGHTTPLRGPFGTFCPTCGAGLRPGQPTPPGAISNPEIARFEPPPCRGSLDIGFTAYFGWGPHIGWVRYMDPALLQQAFLAGDILVPKVYEGPVPARGRELAPPLYEELHRILANLGPPTETGCRRWLGGSCPTPRNRYRLPSMSWRGHPSTSVRALLLAAHLGLPLALLRDSLVRVQISMSCATIDNPCVALEHITPYIYRKGGFKRQARSERHDQASRPDLEQIVANIFADTRSKPVPSKQQSAFSILDQLEAPSAPLGPTASPNLASTCGPCRLALHSDCEPILDDPAGTFCSCRDLGHPTMKEES